MKIMCKPSGSGKWTNLGEVKAMVITLANGSKLRSGPREMIFDMEQTDADKSLLSAMKIGGGE